MKALSTALAAQLIQTATTLHGLVGAKVYDGRAIEGTALPYVIYNWQAGGMTNETPTDFAEIVCSVKGLAATVGAANDVDSAISDRLHNVALSVSGWAFVSGMRESEVQYDEQVNGVTVFHRGALYRFRLSKT